MEDTNKFINSEEVISIENRDDNVLISYHTYKAEEFLNRLEDTDRHKKEKLKQVRLGSTPNKGYFSSGVNAEILEPKSGEWKKGKVRMRVILEFCPDEPEVVKEDSIQRINSLDDIRQTI